MFLAEVDDRTRNVGTSVKPVDTMLDALRYVSTTTREPWAGSWRVRHFATGITILEGGQ